jgi:ribosomal-protein-alanine acetyltransferase
MNARSEAVRIRPMIPADVERVREIADSLTHAPHWPAAAYLVGLDPEALPRRIALVAEMTESSSIEAEEAESRPAGAEQILERLGESGEADKEHPSGAKAQFTPLALSARLKSCPFKTVGFAVASLVPPQAELETIAVAAEAQRSGLARRLFAELAHDLKQAHVTEVMLEVRASNTPALALYRSLGFRESGLRRSYYADPEEDAVLLSLSLA